MSNNNKFRCAKEGCGAEFHIIKDTGKVIVSWIVWLLSISAFLGFVAFCGIETQKLETNIVSMGELQIRQNEESRELQEIEKKLSKLDIIYDDIKLIKEVVYKLSDDNISDDNISDYRMATNDTH